MRNRKDDVVEFSVKDEWENDSVVTNTVTAVSVGFRFFDPLAGERVNDSSVGVVYRDKEDEFDPQVGYNIAYLKALRDFANRQLRRHHNYLEMQLHNRVHAEEQAVKAQERAEAKNLKKAFRNLDEQEAAVKAWGEYLATQSEDELENLCELIEDGWYNDLLGANHV